MRNTLRYGYFTELDLTAFKNHQAVRRLTHKIRNHDHVNTPYTNWKSPLKNSAWRKRYTLYTHNPVICLRQHQKKINLKQIFLEKTSVEVNVKIGINA